MTPNDKYYINLVLGYEEKADQLRRRKYTDWSQYVGSLLDSEEFLSGLMRKLRLKDLDRYAKKKPYPIVDYMISDLTGLAAGTVHSLRQQPSADRDKMFAFAYGAGIDHSALLAAFEGGPRTAGKPLNDFFKEAMLPKPDFRDIDDYIYMCANVMFEKMLRSGKHISRRTTVRSLQTELRNQIEMNLAVPDDLLTWQDFYANWAEQYVERTEKIYEKTGLDKKVTANDWKKKCPDNSDYLYLICIMFHFNTVQITSVFDHYWKGKDRHPDFSSQDDLLWLYLAENFWRLDETPYERLDEKIQNYISKIKKAKTTYRPTVLEYRKLFSDVEFDSVGRAEPEENGSADTYSLDGLDALYGTDRNPLKNAHFIAAKGDPMIEHLKQNVRTEVGYDSTMDMLHATDPSRVLWYWKKDSKGKPGNFEEEIIQRIFYGKEKTQLYKDWEEGAEFLDRWTGNSNLHEYLRTVVFITPKDKEEPAVNEKGKKNSAPYGKAVRNWSTTITNCTVRKGKYPKRRDLIVLGIILSMPSRAIDELLKRFGYSKLNNRDFTECVLLKILEDLEELCPEVFIYERTREKEKDSEEIMTYTVGNNIKSGRKLLMPGGAKILAELYPDWVEGDLKDPVIINPDIEELGRDLDPGEVYRSFGEFSLRLHVRLCLLAAGFEEDNWLVAALYWKNDPEDLIDDWRQCV